MTGRDAERRSHRPPTLVFGPIPRWARPLLAIVALLLVLRAAAFGTFRVEGGSMEDTLVAGDLLLVSKLGPTAAAIARGLGGADSFVPPRGALVVFELPTKRSLVLVKRVIGLPGDRVVIRDGAVTVYEAGDGAALADPRGPTSDRTEGDLDAVVPAGRVFVLGDNRAPGASIDSRAWGELPIGDVVGVAVMRIEPIRTATLLGVGTKP
jgi:signal peptidase I